ncbi:aromatic ring-hydroxylating oxygenase subunit alpha [Aspergillus lucknowensis]|uniref:Choline monooxygenase, chloroplastic n=1 Tax=Aspergillus lucknowensis TaxID=176173 RepID=A0ABR4M442_9EURO
MVELARTLPASWYCSPPLYQLERRAVFLKSWYLLGPLTRFKNVGETVSYEVGQQPVSAVRSCGEADLPVAEEIKVVCADTEIPLRHHVTPTGLVFTTLSEDAPSFHEYFPELEPLLQRVDFTKLPYKRSIKYEGRFNWKTMVDGYQECLHCQYTHPSFSVYYPPTFYEVHNHQNFSQHIADPQKPDDGLFLYFFPICTLNVYGGGMSSFRVCPTEDPNVTRMEFDYYHKESGEKFEEYFRFVRQVAMEDYELCEKAQDNLTRGVYREGILNPEKENGVSFYQERVFELVCQQHAAERAKEADTIPEPELQGSQVGSVQIAA